MSWEKEIEEIRKREKLALRHGGKEAVNIQHAKGRNTLRERIDFILDKGSFNEVGKIAGSSTYDDDGNLADFSPANFLLGFGKINNRNIIFTNGSKLSSFFIFMFFLANFILHFS